MDTKIVESSLVVANYEATVSTGLENIAKDEVFQKFGIVAIPQQGRIWFSTDTTVEKILKLKCINNLFVVIYDEKLEHDKIPTNESELETKLMEVAEKCDWRTGLLKWKQVRKFDCDLDKLLIKDEDLRSSQPKFRVSSNRFGAEHKFTSPEICSSFGHAVDTKFGWPIKLKGFDLQIMANFNENHLYVCFTLTPMALDLRINIVSPGLTTLRGPVCYALLKVADIQCGDIVVDPMAGSGAIPVECCWAWQEEWLAHFIAGELDEISIGKCRDNLRNLNNGSSNDLLRHDVTSMPFRENSIDVFVSDLPFGKRHGSKKGNKTLYPSLLLDMGRVARLDSGRAVLLTQDAKSLSIAYKKCIHLWKQKLCTFVKVGNLNCYIHLFLRNGVKFHS